MATYIQGVQGYIPQIQPFQPDLNFYKGVMDVKESQYKAGYDKISNMYGQLLNSELTRDINNERRSKFFDQITGDIQKMAGVDLSLEQNVDAAYQIFQPLIDDKNVIKDMAWTKNLNSEFRKSEAFRNCTDEKKCGGKWWEGGVQALKYQQLDFANATDDQALNFANARYTPYVNVVEKATLLAKDMGFNVQSVSMSPDGKYIVTTKNGPAMTMSLNNYFNSVFGNDPQVQDLYKTKAYLERKNYAYGNADQYGSVEAAEQVYLNDAVEELQKYQEKGLTQAQRQSDKIQLKLRVLEKRAKGSNIDLTGDSDVAMQYQQLKDEAEGITSVIDQYSNSLSLLDKSTLSTDDLDNMRWRVDQSVAGGMLTEELYNAANTYANLTMEQDIKADPYELASFESRLASGRAFQQHQYQMELAEFKAFLGYGDEGSGKTGKVSPGMFLRNMQNAGQRGGGNPFANNNVLNYTPVGSSPMGTSMLGSSNPNNLNNLMNNTVVNTTGEYKKGEDLSTAVAEKNLYDYDINQFTELKEANIDNTSSFLYSTYLHYKNIISGSKDADLVKLAKESLIDIIGEDNYKFAVKSEIIDQNFNILDPVQFQLAVGFNPLGTDKKTFSNNAFRNIVANKDLLFDDSEKGYLQFNSLVNQHTMSEFTSSVFTQIQEANKLYTKNVLGHFKNLQASELVYGKDKHPFRETIHEIEKFMGNLFGLATPGSLLPLSVVGMVKQAVGMYPSELLKQPIDYVGDIFKKQNAFRNKDLATLFFEKDGVTLISKDQFIKDNFDAVFSTSGMGGSKADLLTKQGRPTEENKDATIRILNSMYDTFVKEFKAEYASGKPGYNTSTHTTANTMYAMVDPAYFQQSTAFWDAADIFRNYTDVKGDPTVKVFNGLNITSQYYKNNKSSEDAIKLMNLVQNDLMNNTYSPTDKNRPLVTMLNQRIALNDPTMTAYTFTVNDAYLDANKGSEKSPGVTSFVYDADGKLKPNANTYTIIIPSELANNSYYQNTTKGVFQTAYDLSGSASLDLTGLHAKIENVNGVPQADLTFYVTDPNTGELAAYIPEGNLPYFNPSADIDDWFNQIKLFNDGLMRDNIANQWLYKQRHKKK